jgi:fibronectin-binding autotransporter adhesin
MVPRPQQNWSSFMTDITSLRSLSPSHVARVCKVGAVLLAGLPISESFAASFSWQNVTGTFTDATKWAGGVAPTGTDDTDILIFGGSAATAYTATSNGTNPFRINQLVFNATGTPGAVAHTIDGGTPLRLGGNSPMILQSGTGNVSIKAAIQLGANLTIDGTIQGTPLNETNNVTLDGTLSGLANITKNGTFTFRFGSPTGTTYSQNTWYGNLTINAGTIRFNNNAFAAPTALRSNPVTMNSASALLFTRFGSTDPTSSLRFGTLNGTAGTVKGQRDAAAGAFDSIDIVINTIDAGTFGGTVDNSFSGAGNDNGRLIIRGTANQTFTGTLFLAKDVAVGRGAGMTLAGNATHLGLVNSSAVVLNGGTFTLDNVGTNNGNRLRDGASNQTGLESIGGGKFALIGNAAGTNETMGRLQLGSASAARSGALTIDVTSNGGTGTALSLQSYARVSDALDSTLWPMNTVNFTANDGAAPLGTSATGPRTFFIFSVPTQSNLLANTAGTANVGWATVNGRDFAGYNLTLGVQAVTSTAAPASGTGNASTNAFITSNLTISSGTTYSLRTLKIDPASDGQSVDISSTGNFATSGILLAGTRDFTIGSTGSGQIASIDGLSPRYFHVGQATLTVEAGLAGTNTPVVKSGAGLLNLTGANLGVTAPLVINEGTVRATVGSSLPDGELRLRGGVLELNGGIFSRQLGGASGRITWTGLNSINVPIGEDQGSGGFSAFGSDVTIDLRTTTGISDFQWEDPGFVNSGHALIFGSTRADAKVTWIDNLNLTAGGQSTNYNAREIRVIDNPSSPLDAAVLSGRISGAVNDDLLKTGDGTLILTSALNDYRGATIVQGGTLLNNGVNQLGFLTNVRNNATFGGNGTVGRVKVESGGRIAPGNAIGNTSVLTTGDMILADVGAKLAIELGGTTIGGNGVNGYDQLIALGEVILNGGTLEGALLPGFAAAPGTLFFIVANDGTDPVQGTFAQGSQILIGGEPFNISYAGDALTSTFTGGNDIVLEYVPEPTSAALLACGAAALGLTRRRRTGRA